MLEALTVTDAYAVLTGGHGWSPDDYEGWLARAISDSLDDGVDGANA